MRNARKIGPIFVALLSAIFRSSLVDAQTVTTQIAPVPTVAVVQQTFATEPKDASVRVGSSVLLECKVQNRRGVLQWTRDGFGLGHDRILDEYPRYSIAGYEHDGDFSLKIDRVTLEDDAEFQCQVGAAEANKGIRSKVARLTVQIPPNPPEIVPRGGVNTTAGTKVELVCETHGGKPEPELSWIEGDGSTVTSKVEKKSWSPEGNKLLTVSLKWTLTAESKHDGKVLKCQVKSPALDETLLAQIPILVKYKPEVLLKVNSSQISEYEDVSFSCESKSANPSEVFYKWYRNALVVNGAYSNSYVIPKITRDYNKQDVSCEIGNAVGLTKQTLKLNVNYGPLASLEVKYAAVSLGGALKLTCDLDGNPKPAYSWAYRGVTVERDKELKIKAATKEDAGKYTCKATVLGFPEATSDFVVLINGPPNVTQGSIQHAYDGDDIRVDCEIQSVPFVTSVRWEKGGKVYDLELNDSVEILQRNITNGLVNTLVIRDPRDADYGEYNCTAFNALGQTSALILLLKIKKFQMLIILGGVIGGVVFVVTFTIAVLFCLRTRFTLTEDDYAKSSWSKSLRSVSLWSSDSESTLKGTRDDRSTVSSETDTGISSDSSSDPDSSLQDSLTLRGHQHVISEATHSRYNNQRGQFPGNTFPLRNVAQRQIAAAQGRREVSHSSFNLFERPDPDATAEADGRFHNYEGVQSRDPFSNQGLFRALQNYDLPNVTSFRNDYVTAGNLPTRTLATHV